MRIWKGFAGKQAVEFQLFVAKLDWAAQTFGMKSLRSGLLTIVLVMLVSTAWAAEPPKVKVENIRRAFSNGEHNAFTDLIRWRGKFWLTFRSCPDGHMVHPTSRIFVLSSDDMATWEPVHEFSVPKRDVRDPHFLIFKEKLFVYTGTWYCGEGSPPTAELEYNTHLGYAVTTADGANWSDPLMLEGTYGHYIWRAASHGDKAYLCGRRMHEFAEASRTEISLIEAAMLESDDGLIWRARSLFRESEGNETAFLFEPNGDLLGIARRGNAEVLRSKPPYDVWDRQELGRYIGGPLLAKWGEHYVVGGRKQDEDHGPKTSLYWLEGDQQLLEFAELPSGGDNSYPGFIDLGDGKALVSWYSTHEKDDAGKLITAIYLADLAIAPPAP